MIVADILFKISDYLLQMDQEKLICVIGDEDTVTGFLLAGVGQRDARGANFLVVDASEFDLISSWHASVLQK